MSFLNTTRDLARPGGATVDNVRWTLRDLSAVFHQARASTSCICTSPLLRSCR